MQNANATPEPKTRRRRVVIPSIPWADLAPQVRAETARVALQAQNAEAVWSLVLVWSSFRSRIKSPHSFGAYRVGVLAYLRYVRTLEPDPATRLTLILEPHEDLIPAYFKALELDGQKPQTINSKRAAGNALYRALNWAGATTANPSRDTTAINDPEPKHEKRAPYPEASIRAMLEAGTDWERACVLLASDGALRAHEAVNLEWASVDLEHHTLRVIGKGRKPRTVSLSPNLTTAITVLPRFEARVLAVKDTDTLRRRVHALCERAGVPYMGYHSLRHSCLTWLYRTTRDLQATAAHAGHSNIQTTTVYAKFDRSALETVLALRHDAPKAA